MSTNSNFSIYGILPLAVTSGEIRLPELIGKAAYDLYEKRGRGPGRDVEDWLQAERETKHHLGIKS